MNSESELDRLVSTLDYPMFLVTVAAGGELAGCLVGFVTQCSIGPVRFLVCLSKTNRTYRVSAAARLVAVHLLGTRQHDLAALFGAQTGDEIDKFARCTWRPGPEGVPLLDACPRRFVGTILDRVDLGDHEGVLLDPIQAEAGDGDAEPPMMFSAARLLDAGHEA